MRDSSLSLCYTYLVVCSVLKGLLGPLGDHFRDCEPQAGMSMVNREADPDCSSLGSLLGTRLCGWEFSHPRLFARLFPNRTLPQRLNHG